MTVKVTQECIDSGKPLSGKDCPVSIAIQAQINKPVVVDSYFAGWRDDDGRWVSVVMPFPVRDWIGGFDGGVKCLPFEFEIPL